MKAFRTTLEKAVLLAALGLMGCGGSVGNGADTAPRPSGSAEDLEAIYRARIDSARTRFTEADVRFMTGMIVHHAQAIVMARLASDHGASRSIQTLAARIINAQKDEIETMERWLRDRSQPVPEVEIEGTGVAVDGTDHAMHMPGMLTPEQMRELDRARGPEFDRLFLTMMIQHHRGAVDMVEALFSTDGAGQDEEVFRFASDVQVDQATEVARMELMLSNLPSEGGGP